MCVCERERERDWVTLRYSRKFTEHCKPTTMEKIKIILKKEARERFLLVQASYLGLDAEASSIVRENSIS